MTNSKIYWKNYKHFTSNYTQMKNIKYYITYSLLFLIAFCNVVVAQEQPVRPKEKREQILQKIEAQRVAFLTSRLELTADESAKFWPLYNDFTKKRQALRKEMRSAVDMEELDEDQSAKAVDDQFVFQEKELALKKNYYEKFKTAIPSNKLAKLEPAELEFRQEVMKRIKEYRKNRRIER
jgi:hypothetical protein